MSDPLRPDRLSARVDGTPEQYNHAHESISRYQRDVLRERWFGSDDGLIPFAYEAVKTKMERGGKLVALPRELYIIDHFENFLRENCYFVLKSRQILITWTTFIALLWETLRFRYATTALIPKDKEDGAAHIEDRIRQTLWPTLPQWLQDDFTLADTKGFFRLTHKRGVLDHGGRWDSWIVSFARGAHQARQYAHRRLFFDEMGYQEHARAIWQGSVPTILGREGDAKDEEGKVVCVSTLQPESFHDILMGKGITVDNAIEISLGLRKADQKFYKSPGLGICHYRNTQYDAFCAVYSFLADSKKRTPEWERRSAAKLGGIDSPEWQLEYRMQRDAFRGRLVFPHFGSWNIVPERKIDPECEIFLSFDFGHTNPTAVLGWEWNEHERTLTCFMEIYLTGTEAGDMKKFIQADLSNYFGMPFDDINFSDQLGDNVGDPNGANYMLSYSVEPNPLVIRGNPPPNPGGITWKINTPVESGESRLDAGFRPSFVCCGFRQYCETGKLEGVCVGVKSDAEGNRTNCGRTHVGKPMVVLMEGRTPNLLRELPLQQRVDPGDPLLEPGEKSRKGIPNHACDSARYAVMRYPNFLELDAELEPKPRFMRFPVSKLTANEAFWRERYEIAEKSRAAQEVVEEPGEIGYPDEEEEDEEADEWS